MLPMLLPLLLQIGPAPTVAPVSPLPPELQERRTAPAPTSAPEPRVESGPLAECLSIARGDPGAAISFADERLAAAAGLDAAHLHHCRGVALAAHARFEEAAAAFAAARDAARPEHAAYRARLGALAGNAALAAGDAEAALGAFDRATADAGGRGVLAGEIALDSARALVALGDEEGAATALGAARAALPLDPQAWLLSATLSRRTGDLAAAQTQIEKAADLDPRDTAIGLEAGVIAALGGREEAARKSWLSVIEASPASAEAEQARAYLAQLDARGAGGA